ncbi:terminase large subunit domain-containing protein [Lichenicola cladoniae]|nr:terminase family protein [Lichenicola cladoniae]
MAGALFRERLLRAGNQLGKTFAGGAEAAFHLTGEYPDWWQGRRFPGRTRAWLGGPSGELVRDGPQRVLLGPPDDWGTGTIPKASIVNVTRAAGVRDLADTITVRHKSGETSEIKLKSYDQGRQRWQAATLEWVWFDEEPPADIYLEGMSRTNATGGMIWLTFTPLLGVSDVVMRFLQESSPDRSDTVMTIDDAEHIPPAERARIIASYPAHEREARTRGTPTMGSGRVFPVPEEDITCEPFPIPPHWTRIGALDFGWDHPTAAVSLAWDRDQDIVYVTRTHRLREATPLVHAATLKTWGAELPWAWPHDGLQHDKGSGEQLAQQYRKHGLKMLPERAQFTDGTNGVEAGLADMLERMESGRLKVFRNLGDWFEEFRLYHRKDGRVVKERDDLMSATRYGSMSLRFSRASVRPIKTDAAITRMFQGNSANGWMCQ